MDATGEGSTHRPATGSRPFVGRAAELEVVTGAIRDLIDGHGAGRLVLVTGEPGIGKTRLIEAAVEQAASDALILWGRCWDSGGAPPFWPWVQVLRELTNGSGGELGDAVVGDDPVAQLLDVDPPTGVGSDERFARFERTSQLLARASAVCPLIVVLDDLHASDEASLLLARFVAHDVALHRFLLIGAFRDTDADSSPAMRQLLGSLAAHGRLLPLRGLAPDELDDLIRAQGVEPIDAMALHAATGGNPFFAHELLRVGQVEDLQSIPLGVRGAVRWRLDRLPAMTTDVLAVAAVLGREFSSPDLERLSGRPTAELVSALEPALQAGVVTSQGLGRFAFSHGLVRETIYEDLGETARCQLHLRAFDARTTSRDEPDSEHLSFLAHHAVAALPLIEPARALDAVQAAAHLAWDTLAFEEAARLWRTAQEVGRLADLETAVTARFGLCEADALAAAGRMGPARDRYAELAEDARRRGDSRLQALAALGFGSYTWDVWLQDGRADLQRAALAAIGPDGDPVLRSRLTAHLATALVLGGDRSGEGDRLAQEARTLAEATDDGRAQLEAIMAWRASLRWSADDARQRLSVARRQLELAEALGDRDAALRARWGLVHDLFLTLDRSGADAETARLALEADAAGYPLHRWGIHLREAMVALLAGRFPVAEELIGRAAAFGQRAGLPLTAAVAGIQTFLLFVERDQVADLRAAMASFPAAFLAAPVTRCSVVWLAAAVGDLDEARAGFRALATDDFAAIPADGTSSLCALAFLSDAAIALEDQEAIRSIRAQLQPHRGLMVHAPGWAVFGTVDLYLGSLALAAGDTSEAIAILTEAVTQCQRVGAPTWEAHARLRLSGALQAAGEVEEALAQASRARTTASALGMTRLLRLLDEASAADVRSRPAATAAHREVILEREGEYWSVVGSGGAFRLRDSKGLRFLSHLVAAPETEVHVLDLVAAEEGVDAAGRGSLRDGELVAGRPTGVGPALDPQAKQAYRRRVDDLREEIEEATRFNDPERRSRAEEELDFIARELAGAVGLGGRDRPSGSRVEQSRINVTKAIRAAIRRIAAQDESLGTYLNATVRTGVYCSYSPSTAPAGQWTITAAEAAG